MDDYKNQGSFLFRYLQMGIEYLNWATHVNQLCVELVKANAMLSRNLSFC